ncbi:hypothetical protein [Amphritea pacifica]|uniref:Uncharacterized protein n=1 Tax=Amphritea pacifica TaxID=2811233 RepID=A0ABS2WCY9_9GAMM|nr:hypothetical protein [Amphritea pacifica]MBN0989227.1 hypothetical protein [Amphritea pacifica]
MHTLTLVALIISSMASALLLKRAAQSLVDDQPKATLQAASLSLAFIGVAALADLLTTLSLASSSIDLQTFQRLLSNLAYYAAIPLLASAMLVSARNSHWSRPAWGRWLIGLFALFELLRRMEHGEIYTQMVAVAVSAAMLASAFMTGEKQLRSITLLAAINMAVALMLTGPGNLVSSPLVDSNYLYPLLLAAALPLCAMSIKQMVRFNQQQA